MPRPCPLPVSHRTTPRSVATQRGAGLLGFLLVALPVLWLGLGGVELAHWMQIRQVLSLSLMETARAGATRHGEPQAMAATFEHSVRQLHPGQAERDRLFHHRRQVLGLPWQIIIHQPLRRAFADHADPRLPQPHRLPGQQFIRNEAQALQHRLRVAQGWREGRGPVSGTTIFEANTLELALRWPHQPLLPGIQALVRALAPLATNPDNRQWMAAGYLPFRRSVSVAMQSAPATWPDLPDGRILHAHAAAPTPGGAPDVSGHPLVAPNTGTPVTILTETPQAMPTPPWLGDQSPNTSSPASEGIGSDRSGGTASADAPDACPVP